MLVSVSVNNALTMKTSHFEVRKQNREEEAAEALLCPQGSVQQLSVSVSPVP